MISQRERNHIIEALKNAIPYAENGMINVSVEATNEIIEMLEEQEPKLLKPEEFAGSYDYVWVETRVSENRSGLFVADICLASDAINYELQMCGQSDRPILEHSQLGKRWRCWNKKPTEAQMRAVKWE